MKLAPAEGERAALRGYRWQYDHIAARVYDAIREHEFLQLRLTDPDAGHVDDLVLVRDGRVDAYQLKSAGHDGYLTFSKVVGAPRRRKSSEGSSLIGALADGWGRLRGSYENVRVHLVAQQMASVNDHLGQGDRRPSPDHFAAFISQVLGPLGRGEKRLDMIGSGWKGAIERMRKASGLTAAEFEAFVQSVEFELGAGTGLSEGRSTRSVDIRALSDTLHRQVSNATSVVELDRAAILRLMNWSGRIALRSPHEFPVDLDTYEPLTEAVRQAEEAIAGHDSGYVAVVGPPGAGKSSLLTQALTGSGDRVLRYYAYVPGTGVVSTRLTARGFLHDLIVMLGNSRVLPRDPELASDDIDDLRRQFADHLDAVGADFGRNGLRTVVVVDGLDHVEREYRGTDSLLGELPRPDALPEGLVFVVGSRTLEPLRPLVRQHLEERGTIVDLQHHRLPPSAILEICRRAPMTSGLAVDIHTRIAELSDGHPLALSYLLNRLRDTSGISPEETLENAPVYSGDVAAEYREVWTGIEEDPGVVKILAVCSRMRIATTTDWIATWADGDALDLFRRRILYLFRNDRQGLTFFHDSFRQFVVEKTCLGDNRQADSGRDAAWHARIASISRTSPDARFKDEELYHQYRAGDAESALLLCAQRGFRDQFLRLREPHLILEDIGFGLAMAAERAEIRSLIGLLLALAEVEARNEALDYVDMPGLLFECGLVDAAVRFCSASSRRSPLAQIYGLAGRLGADGDVEGRRMFDLAEQDGLDDRRRGRIAGQEHDAAVAWAATAPLFRPIEKVIGGVERVAGEDAAMDGRERGGGWWRYVLMMEALVGATVDRGDASGLRLIDSTLLNRIEGLTVLAAGQEEDSARQALNGKLATLVDLRFQVQLGLLSREDNPAARRTRLQNLRAVLRGMPLQHTTMLDVAEVMVKLGDMRTARQLVDRMPFDESLGLETLRAIGEERSGVVSNRFRYWRLRELVGCGQGGEHDGEVRRPRRGAAVGTPPDDGDDGAAALADRIDSAIRRLGRLDAAATTGEPMFERDVLDILKPMLRLFPPMSSGASSVYWSVVGHRGEFMEVVVQVAKQCGGDVPQRLAEAVERCFSDRPDAWPQFLRLQVGEGLLSASASVRWYRQTLEAYENAALREDVYGRLSALADVAHRYLGINEVKKAHAKAMALLSMSHVVGYRKDYQFDVWVAWLGRALESEGGGRFVVDAAWLARVLSAANPMTEGAPAHSAASLAAAVASADPSAAVRIFEYLVRQGEVRHMDALAELASALVTRAGEEGDWAAVETASDLVAEVVAPAASRCYPKLGQAVVAAARGCAGPVKARELAKSIGQRADIRALPTTREGWRRSVELESPRDSARMHDRPEIEEEALQLDDGSTIDAHRVSEQVADVDDIVSLRSRESADSQFLWNGLVERYAQSANDIRRIEAGFAGGSEMESDVLLSLALSAERCGDSELASSLAIRALAGARPASWSRSWGGTRVEAAALACRTGGRQALVEACRDLARQVSSDRSVGSLLIHELDNMVRALEAEHDWASTWCEVREYIEGMAQGLALPDPDVLADKGCLWWLGAGRSPPGVGCSRLGPGEAVAELGARHLSHATWVIRDGAIALVARALGRGSDDMASALSRFADRAETDDLLEAAGRALAAARRRYEAVVPPVLSKFDRGLANHASQVLRELSAADPVRRLRPLSPLYQMTMPPPLRRFDGEDAVYLEPYVGRYEALAELRELDVHAVMGVAERYAREALSSLPDSKIVGSALVSVGLNHLYRNKEVMASRAAFGRVVADLRDAGELDVTPAWVRHAVRTVDIGLLAEEPEARPEVVPVAPKAGHEQTLTRWLDGVETRLDECVGASVKRGLTLLGAVVRLTVLNRHHLGEVYLCGTITGSEPDGAVSFRQHRSLTREEAAGGWEAEQPDSGQPLIIENDGSSFHQYQSDWLAFDPRVAASLGWMPDLSQPGRWRDTKGDVMVKSVWWIDGWWGHGERSFGDTEAIGYGVIATNAGLQSILSGVGAVTRKFDMRRNGRDQGAVRETHSAHRSLVLTPA